MARYGGMLSKQSKYGFRQGGDELHLEKLMPDAHMRVCVFGVCESSLMYNASSEDEDVNVLASVCLLQNVSMCVFLCPPKPNTVNSSVLS